MDRNLEHQMISNDGGFWFMLLILSKRPLRYTQYSFIRNGVILKFSKQQNYVLPFLIAQSLSTVLFLIMALLICKTIHTECSTYNFNGSQTRKKLGFAFLSVLRRYI